MAGGADDRTERPTPRRLSKAREKGQVARSKEVPSAAVLLGGLITISYAAPDLLSALSREMRDVLRMQVPPEISLTFVSGVLYTALSRVGLVVGSIMLLAMVFSFAANASQTGLVLSWEAIGFHFEKISPQNGLSRVFSKAGLVELIKGVAMLTVLSVMSYQVVVKYLPLYPRLVLMDVRQLLYWVSVITYQVFLRAAIFLFILSLADYAFQRHRFLEGLKMTKQEVKDEQRDTEGDPLIRGRIRRIQREMARKRMMTEVPKADVVITNPTHYAVALAYRMESMEAPQVVAKGVGFLALRIKELAQQHRVPIVENKPLAQTLYKTVDLGRFIPPHLYKAVAEILAYIFKAKGAWKR
jgi:flagellar biosynthetic protein FlhB